MSNVIKSDFGWPRVGVSAAVFCKRRVLLVCRAKQTLSGQWSLPGGHVETGETLRDAVRRELHEETSLIVGNLHFVDIHEVILANGNKNLQAHYVIAVFAAYWRSGTLYPASDCTEACWVPIRKLAVYNTTEGAEAIIRQADQVLSSAGHHD